MFSIQSGHSTLSLTSTGEKFGVVLSIATDGLKAFFSNEKPLYLEIKTDGQNVRMYEDAYETCEMADGTIICRGRIQTDCGSVFAFEDRYASFDGNSSFLFRRNVEVVESNPHDLGFATQFALAENANGHMEDYHYFAPGVWYSDNKQVVSGAIASDYKDEHFYFRATRLSLPLVMMQNKSTNLFLSFCHYAPVPNSGLNERTTDWLVDESLQYPSLGVKKSPTPSLRYVFPGSEGEKNYIGPNHVDQNQGWARRSHPVKTSVKHRYELILKTGRAENFASAMKEVWRYHLELFDPQLVQCDLKKVYEAGVQLLNTYCQEYNGVMGLPFWTHVPGGQIADVTFQIGFVGQQLQVAYHLLKYGLENGRADMIDKGERIVEFWCNRAMTPCGLPRVWYDVHPPVFKDHPIYIRMASDGMEGALNAWKIMKKHGFDRPEWFAFCEKYAAWLVDNQNEDGSFYRSYDETGKPLHMGKFNTTNPIRFLVHMYWATREDRFLRTALRAGEYAYQHIHRAALYVGGTADNDNTIDKEAGILALYAFLALYDTTGEQKWLDAAKGAADFCETWVYMWKFPVQSYKGSGVFDKVNITGLSLIATGHSHCDIFMSYCAFDFYRLYLLTGDPHYLKVAKILLYNTKQTTDWSGRLGYAYPGLVEESGMIATQYHVGLGKWLPWCTIAEIEPLTRLREWFGDMDIEVLEKEPDRERIQSCNRGEMHIF
jgi:hypothetical protein